MLTTQGCWQLLEISNISDSLPKLCIPALFHLVVILLCSWLFPSARKSQHYNEFSTYGHILISLSTSILNSPVSPEVCNGVEEL